MIRLAAPVVLPCDEPCTVLHDAVVDVDAAGRIGYVGPAAAAPPTPGPELALTGILLPGLVNTHAHTAMTALRGLGGDLPLMRWLTEVIWPAEARVDADDVRVGMLVGALEMLTAGITTSVEMYFYNHAVVDAVLAAGSRAVVTPGIIAVPGWDRLGTWQQMLDGISRWIDADGIRFGPGERIELGYGPHAAYTLPVEALVATGAAARERGALLHIHVAETTGEDAAIREQHGSVPRLLEHLGVLGDGARVLAAHAVQLGRGAERPVGAGQQAFPRSLDECARHLQRAPRFGIGLGGQPPVDGRQALRIEQQARFWHRAAGRPARCGNRGWFGHRWPRLARRPGSVGRRQAGGPAGPIVHQRRRRADLRAGTAHGDPGRCGRDRAR